MSWVHDRLHAGKESRLVSSSNLYNELWDEISARVAEAQDGGMPVSTNGSSYERVVVYGSSSTLPYRKPRQLTITLARDKSEIVADSNSDSLDIPIEVGADGVAYLKHRGKQLSIPQAAKLILEPFLFPPAE
jgi:hypothetical protein